MGRESARLYLGELIGLAEDLHRCHDRFRDECRQLLQDMLSEVAEQSDRGLTRTHREKSGTSGYRELRHGLETQWHEADGTVEDLCSQVCDTVYTFVNSAEARIAAYERKARHRAERARLAQFGSKGGGAD
jgi:hypothetical protein